MTTTREADVLRTVLDLLAARRILAFRLNTGAMKIGRRFMRFGVPGMSDVVAFPSGGVLWIECKSTCGVQSDLQRSFQAQVESAGHKYVIARSVEDVLREVEK